jgi:hypothetical protein
MGHPAEEIIAGLIVVGNKGLGGRFSRLKRFLMGSVSEKVSPYARAAPSWLCVRTSTNVLRSEAPSGLPIGGSLGELRLLVPARWRKMSEEYRPHTPVPEGV